MFVGRKNTSGGSHEDASRVLETPAINGEKSDYELS